MDTKKSGAADLAPLLGGAFAYKMKMGQDRSLPALASLLLLLTEN